MFARFQNARDIQKYSKLSDIQTKTEIFTRQQQNFNLHQRKIFHFQVLKNRNQSIWAIYQTTIRAVMPISIQIQKEPKTSTIECARGKSSAHHLNSSSAGICVVDENKAEWEKLSCSTIISVKQENTRAVKRCASRRKSRDGAINRDQKKLNESEF